VIPWPGVAEVCVLYGPELGAYAFDDPHPFGRRRLPAFWREFLDRGLDARTAVETPEMADAPTLARFHDGRYVRFVQETRTGYLDSGDTPAFPDAYDAARRVVGTTLKAVRLVMEGRFRRAFCPIGGLHHARRDRAGGFCIFNDIGVAIQILRSEHDVRRIGYVDIDAHHGDGVYYEYKSDPELFIADIHENGRFLYPGTGFANETGVGAAAGTKLNLPMMPGAGEDEFFEAFERVEAFLAAAKPEFIMLQCGADSLKGDPLAHLQFSPKTHRHAAERLRALSPNRLVAMGGGGYSPENISRAWCEVIEALI